MKQTIKVNRALQWKKFDFTVNVQKRTRKTSADSWGAWEEMPYQYPNLICGTMNAALTEEFRTLLTFNENAFTDVDEDKRVKLYLEKASQFESIQGYVKVNGEKRYVYKSFTAANFDLGTVKTIKENNYTIAFEYENSYFFFTAVSGSTPKMLLCKALSSGYQTETRSFALAGGASARLDMSAEETIITVPDIELNSSLLSFGISHIFRHDQNYYGVGHNFKLNLHQRLSGNNQIIGQVKDYFYIDELGNEKALQCYFTYEDDNGVTQTYGLEEPSKRLILENGVLKDTELGKTVSFTGRITFGELMDGDYVVPASAAHIEYFRSILSPKLFIVKNKNVKGFDDKGHLIWLNDEYGNYLHIQYNDDENIEQINQNGVVINFTYDEDNVLSRISDPGRKRMVEYDYFTDLLTVGKRLRSITYRTMDENGQPVETYKQLIFQYAESARSVVYPNISSRA